jgi:hypothetical protein
MAAKTWEVDVVADTGKGGGDIPEAAPEGNWPAVCVAVIDLGTQNQKKYQSQEMEEVRKIFLVWELMDVEGSPLVHRDFRASMHEKAGLRNFLSTWIGPQANGTKFNFFALTGKQCLLNVTHTHSKDGEKTWAFADKATPLPKIKGKPWELPAPSHDPVAIAVNEADQLPGWLPYLWGRPIKEWLAGAKENRRKPAGRRQQAADEYSPDEAEPEDTIPY